MGSRLQQPVSIASNIFATLPCPRHLARVFLCRALPCVKLAAARAPWRMTRDPLAVARDLAWPAPWRAIRWPGAIRWPWRCRLRSALPLPPCLRSAGRGARSAPLPAIRVIRWPRSAGRWRADPCPMPADPASSAGRSGVIRWPIRRHPLADPASSAGRSGVIRWPPAIRCLRSDQARSRIRAPRVRGPYGN
jgi:hypothetical protein